jgi:transcription elongation factor Elf1
LGRRRRRVIKVVKKKLPTVFTCPTCSEETVKVTISKGAGKATVRCASCGLKQEIDVPPSFDIIDVYCSFADKFYSKDRPASQTSEPAQVA